MTSQERRAREFRKHDVRVRVIDRLLQDDLRRAVLDDVELHKEARLNVALANFYANLLYPDEPTT